MDEKVALVEKQEKRVRMPKSVPMIPLRDTTLFPNMLFPFFIGRKKSVRALEEAMEKERLIALFAQKEAKEEDPRPEEIYGVGTIASITQILKMPDGTVKTLVEGMSRVRATRYIHTDPFFLVEVETLDERSKKGVQIEALKRNVISLFEQIVKLGKPVPPDAFIAAINVEDPGKLADLITFHLNVKLEERQLILETADVAERLARVSEILTREIEILELEGKIHTEVKKEVEKTQREFFLRKQMEAIQKELGEVDDQAMEATEYRQRIKESGMPKEVEEKALKEVERLAKMPPAAAEAVVVRTYLDWLVTIPWKEQTEDHLDIKEAEKVLNEDHYGLEKVKERILEYLAVRRPTKAMKSPILCFVGPPGVGKTSLGKSIARALGRKFIRISLGGIRDEAEIRGHRRTYIGAMPGRIIQGMRNAGKINPVFMLDEIDKVGVDFRGDPSAALLEVLDPEQNNSFSDHYLDVSYDLSQVMFICTANILHTIPPALRDRLEVIHIPGYVEEEKLKIAQQFLIRKQLEAHGIKEKKLSFSENGIRKIIREYTREAGVRNLEREIAAVCRKVARKIVEGNRDEIVIQQEDLHDYLGPHKFFYGTQEEKDEVGAATGLAWTEFGGDILTVECTLMDGKGKLILTGQLGDVMQESAKAALSYIRSHRQELHIPKSIFDKKDIHIHVPAGAIPKDGPSAGITMCTAAVSLLTGTPVKREVAMTGEITLRGRVLPVGGIKEKVLSAHRAGIKKVILPEENRKDLEEIPKDVQEKMTFHFVKEMGEVLKQSLKRKKSPPAKKRKSA